MCIGEVLAVYFDFLIFKSNFICGEVYVCVLVEIFTVVFEKNRDLLVFEQRKCLFGVGWYSQKPYLLALRFCIFRDQISPFLLLVYCRLCRSTAEHMCGPATFLALSTHPFTISGEAARCCVKL